MSDQATPAIDRPELYQQCFRDSNDAIAITDAQGLIVTVNRAFEELYGYAAAEVIGQTTTMIKSKHSSRAMYDEMWSDIRTGAKGFWKGEIINRKKSGEEVPVLLSITPIRDREQLIGYMGIAIDITGRKQLEAFKDLYDKVMRHDLKAPLGAVVALSEALLAGDLAPDSEAGRHCVERINRRAVEMLEAINSSLDLDRLSRGTLRVNAEEVEVLEVLRESFETLDHLAQAKQVRLVLDPGSMALGRDGKLAMTLDRIYLRRACDNLLKNAIEAAPPESVVTVTLAADADRITFSFMNLGNPIPETVKATLFHPFSTYGKRGGTGLGLTGVKMVTEAMGGSVAYSSDRSGTSFTLDFPASLVRRPT